MNADPPSFSFPEEFHCYELSAELFEDNIMLPSILWPFFAEQRARVFSLKELAEALQFSPESLRPVLSTLVTKGWLSATVPCQSYREYCSAPRSSSVLPPNAPLGQDPLEPKKEFRQEPAQPAQPALPSPASPVSDPSLEVTIDKDASELDLPHTVYIF